MLANCGRAESFLVRCSQKSNNTETGKFWMFTIFWFKSVPEQCVEFVSVVILNNNFVVSICLVYAFGSSFLATVRKDFSWNFSLRHIQKFWQAPSGLATRAHLSALRNVQFKILSISGLNAMLWGLTRLIFFL